MMLLAMKNKLSVRSMSLSLTNDENKQ